MARLNIPTEHIPLEPPHPVIVELFKLLPMPGCEFSEEDRSKWFAAISAAIDLIYREKP